MPSTETRTLTSVPRLPVDLAAEARNRADRSMSGLATLLAERPELRGVHAPADLAFEAIRWSA